MSERPLPLIVDLDDTLVRTDTLLEQLTHVAFRRPAALFGVARALLRGRAAFKRAVAAAALDADFDVRALPYDPAVLAYATDRRAAGGEVYLVTAADQAIADRVAAHLGVFDNAAGSHGDLNLKGADKARAVAARFPDGFAYIGDSRADLHLWRQAGEVLTVGGEGVSRRLAREGVNAHHHFPRPAGGAAAWMRELRVHQWTKNAVVLVPLILSQQYRDPDVLLRALIGVMLFNLVVSATYIFNDVSDLGSDRTHPTKRARPIAAGLIHLRAALPVAAVLLVGGLAGALAIHPAFGLMTLTYVVVTLLYSYRLKAEPLIDVLTIGGLFTVRVTAGMLLVAAPVSLWLCTFTFMLFTSLALAKRHGELARAHAAGSHAASRGYLPGDTLITAPLGMATGVSAVLVMVLYMELEARMTGLYQHVEALFLTPVVLAAWILRIWIRAHRGVLHDDPVDFALRDRVSWAHAGAVGLIWLAAIL